MKLIRQILMIATTALLFAACSKSGGDDPDPTVKVTGVSLGKTSATIIVGATETLTATVAPENATNKNVTWSSNKTDIAKVDASGKVTGVKAGTATITATTEDGGKTATCAVTVSNVAVTGISLNKTSSTLKEGESETLTATIAPANATNKNVTWSSDKTDIATVDASGKVTGVKAGTATITVTTEDGGKKATCTVTVSATAIAVTGVSLNKETMTVDVDASETLTATITPETATNQNVTWSSDKTDIATVGTDGKVTGVKAGTATITVTTEDGGKTATCAVTVKSTTVSVESVSLNKTTLPLSVGASETLTATVAPADATNQNVTWSSDKIDIATVDIMGKVTGVKAGTATITATTEDGGKAATCAVTVSNVAVVSISLNKTSSTLKEGESETLTAIIAPANATNKNVTWSSSKESVAKVDATGKVTAVGAGSTQIVATTEDGGKTAFCNYTVTGAPKGSFTKDGIYYKAITVGGTEVEVTNKVYGASSGPESENSYSGTVNVPATVEYEGVTYTVTGVGERSFSNSPSLTAVVLPEGVTRIENSAFNRCTSLQSVSLPNSLKSIGRYAFYGCEELTALHIPANVNFIEANNTFNSCTKLEITVAAESTNYRIVDGGLFKLQSGNLYQMIWIPIKKTGDYTIPEGTHHIMGHATYGSNLTKITIPASVKVINGNNFGYMENLTDVVLNWADPSGVSIESNVAAFYFKGLIYSNITLHVPAGTKALYEAHALWGMGFKIVEQ